MSVKQDIARRIRNIYSGSNPGWNRGWRRFLLNGIHCLEYSGKEFARDRCFLRAAALTFTTLLTLIPIMVLFFVVFRAFGGLEMLQNQLESFLFKHLLPESVMSIRGYIQALVTGFNSTAVSTVSIVFLILSAYGLFASIDSSLNTIWKAPVSRGFITRLVHLWFILTIVPLFLGYSLYLSAKILKYPISRGGLTSHLVEVVLWFVPVTITWLTFTLIYKFVPRAAVKWGPALMGGFLSAILWEASKHGFNYYVQTFVNLKLLYGSFLVFPLFLIWVDVTWIIILGGAELSYAVQNMAYIRSRQMVKHAECIVSWETTAFLIMALTASAFSKARTRTVEDIGRRIPVPPDILKTCLKRLQKNQLLVVADDGRIVPGKPPEAISLYDIIACFKGGREIADAPGLHGMKEYWYSALNKSLGGMTLQDIISRVMEEEKKRYADSD